MDSSVFSSVILPGKVHFHSNDRTVIQLTSLPGHMEMWLDQGE